jgi:hypothetical protein
LILRIAHNRWQESSQPCSQIKQKKIWQLINKQVGKYSITNKKNELMTATGIETNPQKVAELLNTLFVETVDEVPN